MRRTPPHWTTALAAFAMTGSVLLASLAGRAPAVGAASQTPRHGGTLVVDYQNDVQTIDPNKIYDGEDWNVGFALYAGLYRFTHYVGRLRPWVAASMPVVSDHGRVYTVYLRKDARWSNGAPVTAQDFVASLTRELSPGTRSPDGYLWYMLQGVGALESGRTKTLAGVRALGPHTLQYRLTQPYAAFADILAVPAAMPIYPRAVGRIATAPVTDGPFSLKSWSPGRNMVLVRNPHYFGRPQPYLDGITIDFGVSPATAVLRIQAGQADLTGDGLSSGDYLSLRSNPTWAPDIVRFPVVGVQMVALNTRVYPLNKIDVRRAIEMAINKRHLVQLLDGRGVVANGVLPVALPHFGHDIAAVYPYDPARARALLKAAGVRHLTLTLGLASEQAGGSTIATEVQADLKSIGITVDVRPLPQESTAIAHMPMMTYTWFMDYPDPADFVDGFTSCATAVVGGSNPAFLCDPGLDRLSARARAIPPGGARLAAYKAIDRRIMRDAAYVPLFYPVATFLHSARLAGYGPSFSWTIMPSVWLRP